MQRNSAGSEETTGTRSTKALLVLVVKRKWLDTRARTHERLPEEVQEVDVVDEIETNGSGQIGDVELASAHKWSVVMRFEQEQEDQHRQRKS